MKEITAVKINPTDFAPFGTYCSMTEPEGYPLQGEIHKFYPDRISGTCMGKMCIRDRYQTWKGLPPGHG